MKWPEGLERGAWYWNDPQGMQGGRHLMLLTAHSGSRVVLAVAPGGPHKGRLETRGSNGVLVLLEPDHPVAKAIRALPTVLAALQEAAKMFREYEQLHRAKGTEEGDRKALANAALAEQFEAALVLAGFTREDEMPELEPVLLRGLTWKSAAQALSAVDCALRRPHWCSPIVVLQDGRPVIDDDGEIRPLDLTREDRAADDWHMVKRVDENGDEVEPTYRAGAQA